MTQNQTPPPIPSEEPKYGGFTRFEIELEVRCPTVQFQPRVYAYLLIYYCSVHLTLPISLCHANHPLLPFPLIPLQTQANNPSTSSSNPSPHPSTSTTSPRRNTSRTQPSSPTSAISNTGNTLPSKVPQLSWSYAEESRVVTAGEV